MVTKHMKAMQMANAGMPEFRKVEKEAQEEDKRFRRDQHAAQDQTEEEQSTARKESADAFKNG
jgi:hypothetical protein